MTNARRATEPVARFSFQAEQAESKYLKQALSTGPAISTRAIGTGIAFAADNDPSLFWTRAIGFTGQLTDDDLTAILAFYRHRRVPAAMLQLAPWALPPSWPELREAHALEEGPAWFKLGCEIDDARHLGDTDLPITEVDQDHAAAWAHVVRQGFGIPGHLEPALTHSVGRPGVRHFVAWAGTRAVGAASLFVDGEVGYLTTAATLPSHRNRGVQSALIGRRAREAASAGCRRLVAETGKPLADEHNPSLGNLLRAGLKPLHERRNWIWRPNP